MTYGVLLEQVTSGGPADKAGLKAGTTQTTVDGNTIIVGGDIITAINGTRIVNSDDLSSYLEENAPNRLTKAPEDLPECRIILLLEN